MANFNRRRTLAASRGFLAAARLSCSHAQYLFRTVQPSSMKFDRMTSLYSVSQKKSPLGGPDISHFSHKRLRIFNRFFTHLLYVPIDAKLQIFIHLSPTLTKLCHIKRDYPVHIICSKCSPSAKTRALTRLRKSLIALLIVVYGK